MTFSYREVVNLNGKSEGLAYVKFSLFCLELIITLCIGLCLPLKKRETRKKEKGFITLACVKQSRRSL